MVKISRIEIMEDIIEYESVGYELCEIGHEKDLLDKDKIKYAFGAISY